MSTLRLQHEWVEMRGSGDPATDATFAFLQIAADDSNVLRVLDKRAKTVQSQLLVPLYPLAEWVVANWWVLLYEPFTPGRNALSDYLIRHSLCQVGDGFAYPDLWIIPEGSVMRLEWHKLSTRHQTVDFLEEGQTRLPRADAEQTLADLVETVLTRLEQQGLTDTWLAQEWQAVRTTQPDEIVFCQAAARLGLDPYELDDQIAGHLSTIWDELPSGVRTDVFEAANLATLGPTTAWVAEGMQRVKAVHATDGVWHTLRKDLGPIDRNNLPWHEGYRLAHRVREVLSLGNALPVPLDVQMQLVPIVQAPRPPLPAIDGMVAETTSGVPTCYTAKTRPDSQRFIRVRAMFDAISGSPGEPSLLSSAQTTRQQIGRAFAAELLAPANLLRERITGGSMGEEQVEDLATEFQVSTFAIEHQIRNHKLAELPLSGSGRSFRGVE